jgi:hypothetical protein
VRGPRAARERWLVARHYVGFVTFKGSKDPKSKVGRTAALRQVENAVEVVAAVAGNPLGKRLRKARTDELSASPGNDFVRLPAVRFSVLGDIHVSALLFSVCDQRRGSTTPRL